MKKSSTLLIIFVLILAAGLIPTTSADEPIEGRDGRAEVRFLEGMIDHHQMAINMAQDCLEKAETDTVITTCQSVIDAQSAEIEIMRSWLLAWYSIDYIPMAMPDHIAMMEMMEAMPMQDMMDTAEGMDISGMSMMDMMNHMMEMSGDMGGMGMDSEEMPHQDMPMMMGMMAGLDRLEGVDYEIAWLEAMIDHHDDAIHMAERILEREVHPETLEIAQQIITDQTAEIEAMEAMLTELSS
jgi:uncharacterized protein (DUF305 family)